MVIAHIAKAKAAVVLVVGYGVVILLFLETLHVHDGRLFFEAAAKSQLWIPFTLIGWLCGIASALLLTALLIQLVFHDGRAIWIDGDTLIYVSRFFIAIKRNDVAGLSVGPFGHWERDGIIFTLKSGGKKVIPIGALSEKLPSVILRLQEWLGKSVELSRF